jgi:hypothetical protein
MRKHQEIAERFLSEWFQPEETFALLAREPKHREPCSELFAFPT